ncbi:MAG: YigZ family protein [Clostridiales bacterium]|nr:YigZ family protein [Clostridiales bacterium]
MKNFKTVYQEADSLDVINKSRFIGYIKPIKTVEEAQAFIEVIKKKHWDASHNVPVYVLGDQFQVQKYSDDGEPSGTAGVPILNILKNEGITDVVIVVTRYFGGVKLGTGGLVRAYSQSAKSALAEAKVIEMLVYQKVHVSMNYTLHGKFQNYLNLNPEYLVEDILYTDGVETVLYISIDSLESFKSKVIDMTNAQAVIVEGDQEMLPISDGVWIR